MAEDPDSIGDCDSCGSPIGHDEQFVFVQHGFNCHGSMMDWEEDEDELYHRDCVQVKEL